MRDKDPFGLLPKNMPNLPKGMINNYLDIDGMATLLNERGAELASIPFWYDSSAYVFAPIAMLTKNPRGVDIKWQEARHLRLVLEVKYDITIILEGQGDGKYKIAQTWGVKYGDDGVSLIPEPVQDLGSSGQGDVAVAIDVATSELASGDVASTTVLLKLVAGLTDDGVGISVGPLSGSIGGGSTVYSRGYKFKISLRLVNMPVKDIALPESVMRHTLVFEREDQSDISPAQHDRLEDRWADPLQKDAPALAAALKDGKVLVTLKGYASVTGKDAPYNVALSSKRIMSTANAIKAILGSDKVSFFHVPVGNTEAKQKGPSPQEKRVEITIERSAAITAMRARAP